MAAFDEEEPKKRSEITIGEELATWSIDELEERIAILKSEITRVEESIAAKRASLDAADIFFKK